jgi:hypothetical protein
MLCPSCCASNACHRSLLLLKPVTKSSRSPSLLRQVADTAFAIAGMQQQWQQRQQKQQQQQELPRLERYSYSHCGDVITLCDNDFNSGSNSSSDSAIDIASNVLWHHSIDAYIPALSAYVQQQLGQGGLQQQQQQQQQQLQQQQRNSIGKLPPAHIPNRHRHQSQ